MSRTLERIRELVTRREVQVSDHGYDELADDELFVDDLLAGLAAAVVVEDYPAYHKGPCVNSHHHTKLVHEGRYAAEVEVDLIDTYTGWSPYLSLSDAQKLDEVRKALRGGDLKRASQLARVFQLLPVNV